MIPVIGILDDYDSPEANCLVILWGKESDPNVEYISRDHRRIKRESPRRFPKNFTPLAAFGMGVTSFTGDDLTVEMTGNYPWADGKSVPYADATYQDGVPRRWQGRVKECITIRARLRLQIGRAVAEIRTDSPAPPAHATIGSIRSEPA